MASGVKACFFDLDGTLLNTLEDLADCCNKALADSGFGEQPVQAYRFFVGDGMETLMRRAAPPETDSKTLDRLTERMWEEYSRNWARKTVPYPGIAVLLERLSVRGTPICILSNKPHDFALLTVEHFFPGAGFSLIQGSPKGGKAKPDPALALGMSEHLGLRPEEVLFVGDSSTDMDTAIAAGMFPVGVLWGFRPEEELRAHGAKALLARPDELLELLNRGVSQ